MKKISLLFLSFAVVFIAGAQDLSKTERFNMALQSGDHAAQRSILEDWQHKEPNNVDLFICRFNYHINQAFSEHIELSQELPDEVDDYMTITDSTGAVSGYLYSVKQIDTIQFDSAMLAIDKGIALYPNRLDMRFGKIHALGMMSRNEAYVSCIEKTIDKAAEKSTHWVFPDVDEFTQDMFSQSIMDYQGQMLENTNYNSLTANDTLQVLRIRKIANRMLQYWPKDIYQLNILAVTYNLLGDRKESLRILQKAEKYNRKDVVVLANISDLYHLEKNYKKERQYLNKVIRYGTVDEKAWAKERLAELK